MYIYSGIEKKDQTMLNIKLKMNGIKIGDFVFLMIEYSDNENFSKLLPWFEKLSKSFIFKSYHQSD